MIIKALKEFSVDIVTHMIDDDTPYIETLEVAKDEELDVDIVDETDDMYSQLQFPDGSCVFQLPKKLFKVIEED